MSFARKLGYLVCLVSTVSGCAEGLDAARDGSGTDFGADQPGPGDGTDGLPPKDEIRCSDDLHSVVDGNGKVIQTCASDQGCFDGACIGACDAAGSNKGNVGCDFILGTPPFLPYTTQACYAAFVANTWPETVKMEVRWQGQILDVSAFGRMPNGSSDPKTWPMVPADGLPPDQVAVLFLSGDPYSENAGTSLACPVSPAISQATAINGTGRAPTFAIRTSFPVSMYDIMPFGGARSYLPGAQLVLPTTAWGINYVASVSAVQIDPAVPFLGGQGGPMWAQIVAGSQPTTVQVLPKHFTGFPSGPNVVPAEAGKTTTFTLAPGEALQWYGLADPSGSVLMSDEPIAFMGGNVELCLHSSTSEGGGCDSAHQQLPPVSATGFDYAVAPYTTRRADMEEESILYRIVGAVAGTQLQFDPPVDGAPAALGVGDVFDFEAKGAFRVRSQDEMHPFPLTQLMAGGFVEGGSRPGVTPGAIEGGQLGDEELVVVLPPQQYQSRYVFFTDPTYATTNLVLVRVRAPEGFKDVTVECLGLIGDWKPIGSDGQYEYTEVDLARVDPVGSCKNGRQVAWSEGRFGLVVWGLDAWASYAYPAGAAVAPINEVVVLPEPK